MTTEQAVLDFHGATYDEARDMERLTEQQGRVVRAWLNAGWHDADSLARRIERLTGKREKVESVSRQMRYVRQWAETTRRFRVVERDAGGGSKLYRLVTHGR